MQIAAKALVTMFALYHDLIQDQVHFAIFTILFALQCQLWSHSPALFDLLLPPPLHTLVCQGPWFNEVSSAERLVDDLRLHAWDLLKVVL